MNLIDSTGTFRGLIADSVIGTTKNEFPQWVVRLTATEKWIDDPAEMAHFKLDESGWVDWSSFNEEITGYLVLFNNKDVFNKDTQLLNYEQLQTATGWDGSEFDSLGNGTYLNKVILFRVEDNEYNGKVSKRVSWIDKMDADPNRSLKSLDAAGIKSLNSKLKVQAKPVVAAKAGAPTKPGKSLGASSANSPVATSSVKTVAHATPKTTAPTTKTKTVPPAAKAETGVTKDQAWEWLMEHKGENEDGIVADAWIAAMGEVLGDERAAKDNATPAEWLTIRNTAAKDLDLK